MALIRRKTIAVKSDNVSDVLMSNIGAITESVATFQKMEEENNEYDVAMQLQSQKDNYEQEIKKLQARIEKQTERRNELKTTVQTMTAEVEQLDYEKTQYTDKIAEVSGQADTLDDQVAQSEVKEHEIVVVQALIEEKARLAEAKL